MHYKYISSSWGQKSMCDSYEDFQNNEMDICKISKQQVVLGALDRVNIPYLMQYISIILKSKFEHSFSNIIE